MTTCIDLRKHFGDRYRITYDEADGPRHGDPWMQQIPGRFGTIYPFGALPNSLLAVEVDGHPNIVRQLRKLPGVRVHQLADADLEATLLFDLALFDEVARIIRPHRRRQWTAEGRQAALERLAPFRFAPQ